MGRICGPTGPSKVCFFLRPLKRSSRNIYFFKKEREREAAEMAALRNEDTPQSIALIRIAANALEEGSGDSRFRRTKPAG